MRPRLLDLFCGAGGAARGYHDAGFEVVGVDLAPQKHYPYEFHQADAIEYFQNHWCEFDAVHASPPCQRYSVATKVRPGAAETHPDLVAPMRRALRDADLPYIIENVPGAPLLNPVMLCGTMFPGELKVYRHRLFESDIPLVTPPHGPHEHRMTAVGRPALPHGWMTVAGHISSLAVARVAMGIDWMTRDELSQAIPPTYTRYLGGQLLAYLQGAVEDAAD